jgi:hypothetical protein
MFNVLLYSFAKKHNSTKQPDPADAAIFTCELKDGTDILQPVFAFNFGTDSNGNSVNPTNYTYAKVNEFGRYYHIENWSWANGLWIAAMKVDTLATYKTDIGNAELYVVRSAARGDARVIDTKYPAIATLDNQITNTLASPWNVNIETATTEYGFSLWVWSIMILMLLGLPHIMPFLHLQCGRLLISCMIVPLGLILPMLTYQPICRNLC